MSGVASSLLRQRDLRERIFPGLAECGWTILLRLWEADGALSVTSLCFGSFAPYTTALRHIGLLERKGLLERTPNSEDARSFYIGLTILAREKLEKYADAVSPESLAA